MGEGESVRAVSMIASQAIIAVWFGMVCGFAIGFARGRRLKRE